MAFTLLPLLCRYSDGMATDDPAAKALSPLDRWQVSGQSLGHILRDSVRSVKSHDVSGLASDITYHATLAMLPFLLLLVSLPSVTGTVFSVSDPGQQVAQKVGEVFSEDLGSSIQSLLSEVEKSRGWSAFLLGLAGSLLAGTSTTSTIRKALNRIHDCEEDSPFWKRKVREIALTVLVGVIALSSMVAVVAGPALLGLSGVLSEVLFIIYALTAALITASLLYWLAPAGSSRFRWVTPGAVLFVVVWAVFSLGFSLYISNVSNMNDVYGTLGIMAIVIIWLYGSALALLAGAEINAILTRHTDGPQGSPLR